MNSVLWNTRQK